MIVVCPSCEYLPHGHLHEILHNIITLFRLFLLAPARTDQYRTNVYPDQILLSTTAELTLFRRYFQSIPGNMNLLGVGISARAHEIENEPEFIANRNRNSNVAVHLPLITE